jgi:membrane protein DedA with SNARE-associated domain
VGSLHQHVVAFISQYAYGGIFGLLVFGIVGIPVPDEFLLTFVGYLVFRRQLNFAPALAAAFAGSACGITLSYALGRTAGPWVVQRFGRWLHLNESDVQRAHDWFGRLGGWSLVFGYFIAGVRHLTALAAGMAKFEPVKFAAFAYTGALLWTTSFIGLGIYLGERWHEGSRAFRHLSVVALVAVAVAALIYALWHVGRTRQATK